RLGSPFGCGRGGEDDRYVSTPGSFQKGSESPHQLRADLGGVVAADAQIQHGDRAPARRDLNVDGLWLIQAGGTHGASTNSKVNGSTVGWFGSRGAAIISTPDQQAEIAKFVHLGPIRWVHDNGRDRRLDDRWPGDLHSRGQALELVRGRRPVVAVLLKVDATLSLERVARICRALRVLGDLRVSQLAHRAHAEADRVFARLAIPRALPIGLLVESVEQRVERLDIRGRELPGP